MRVLGVVIVCIALIGCAVSSKTEFTRKDLEMFQKTFEGILVGKIIEEIDKEVTGTWFPFLKETELHVYFQITVEDTDGNIRKFFDFTKDKNRIKLLKEYNRDLQKGDTVVVGLGLVDDKNEEEHFELIRKKI
jgi:hypothetical protein